MDKTQFLNRVRSLFNIDGYLLPELTPEQQGAFLRDPVRYFIGTDKAQSDAIWREVERRQLTKNARFCVYSEPDVGLRPSLFEGAPGQTGFAPVNLNDSRVLHCIAEALNAQSTVAT